jgi:hypothetical protein
MKKLSWGSFFIGLGGGFVLGLLVLGLFVNYLISSATSNASTEGKFLSGAIEQVREGMAKATQEKTRTAVYGRVVSIGGGTLVLEVSNIEGTKEYTFTYDDNTEFVYLANDAASTELPLSADTIEAGAGLSVFTNEAIGSVANQYAVKIIQI